MKSLERIRQDSQEINRLLAQINTLSRQRDNAPQQRAAWQAACQDFYARYDGLCFPGGAAMLERVRSGDPAAVEAAVRFLLADPYHFRSGYLKERLWRWLANLQLSVGARNRLERAAMAYLDRRIGREFWAMCKAMARIGRPAFWIGVSARAVGVPATGAAVPAGNIALRAALLMAHGASVHAGSEARRRFYQSANNS